MEELDFFTNPADHDDVNPELGEIRRPELAGNIYLRWDWGDLSVSWQSQYLDEMLLSFLEVETAETLYGDIVIIDETWLHDLNVSYVVSEAMMLHGGVRNVTRENAFRH